MFFSSLSSEHPYSLTLREYRRKLRIVQWMIRKHPAITANDRAALKYPSSSDPRSPTPHSSKVSLWLPKGSSRPIWHAGCKYNEGLKVFDPVSYGYLSRIIM